MTRFQVQEWTSAETAKLKMMIINSSGQLKMTANGRDDNNDRAPSDHSLAIMASPSQSTRAGQRHGTRTVRGRFYKRTSQCFDTLARSPIRHEKDELACIWLTVGDPLARSSSCRCCSLDSNNVMQWHKLQRATVEPSTHVAGNQLMQITTRRKRRAQT